MIRQSLIDEIIRRFPDYIDEEAATGVNGVVGWELIGPADQIDRFSLALDDGLVRVGRDLAAEPAATLRLGVISFLKIANGTGDPCTMVLSGDLELSGDPWLGVRLLRLIRIPTSDGAAHLCGPSHIDVAALARLIGEIPDRQLRERLRDPVRGILLDEIFRLLPHCLDARRAGTDALVEWQITGRDGGGFDEYRMLIRDGSCTIGELPGRPRVSIRTDPVVFIKLITGNASPAGSLLLGRLSIRGDLLLASRLPRIFRVPTG